MNILVDGLPEAVEVAGKRHKIRTDFRICLKTIMACEDPSLTGHEKAMVILTNLFETVPDDLETALEKAKWFLDCGEQKQETDEFKPRVYSFIKDANFIFAAFRQTHGIDLQTEDLHWWKFVALFMDVGGDTTFSQLTSLRKRVKTGKASKHEREMARELGDLFEIDDAESHTLDELESEDEFMKALNKARKQEK